MKTYHIDLGSSADCPLWRSVDASFYELTTGGCLTFWKYTDNQHVNEHVETYSPNSWRSFVIREVNEGGAEP